MEATILRAEALNLPEMFATKFRGKKVELIEDGDTVTIKPVKCVIDEACGMLKDSNFGTNEFLKQKRMDKALEYGE
jgi:virulence-associated protein VagC